MVATEYGTFYINYKGLELRSTFYRYNIDKTIRGFNVQAYLYLNGNDSSNYADQKIMREISKLVTHNWLTLIGVKNNSQMNLI